MNGSRRAAHRSEHLFVVRMWQEPASAEMPEEPAAPSTNRSDWRGTVQHILSGERVYFVQLPDMNAFIRSQLARPASGLEVSWQVTGIRHDVWAEQNRIPVEEDKPADEQGLYLYPQGYGRPETETVDYLPPPSQDQASQP